MEGGRRKMRTSGLAVKAGRSLARGLWAAGLLPGAAGLAACGRVEVRAPIVGSYGPSEERCGAGTREACWEVAELHRRRGEPGKAAPFYEKACGLGHVAACGATGRAYARGEGVPRDAARGSRRLMEACDQGDPAACDEIGLLYRDGAGVPADPARAAKMFQLACERRSDAGCAHLGEATLAGAGVDRDAARGADLLQGACDRGHADACDALGDLYRGGIAVPRDAARAAALHARACAAGSDRACESCRAAEREGAAVVCAPRPKPPAPSEVNEPPDGKAAEFAYATVRFQQYEVRGTDADGRVRTLGVALGGHAVGALERGLTLNAEMHGALGGGGGQVDGRFAGGADLGVRLLPSGSNGPFLRVGFGGDVLGSEKVHRSYFELPRGQLGWQLLTERYVLELALRGSVALTGRYAGGTTTARSYGARLTWGAGVLFQMPPARLEAAYMRTEAGALGPLDELRVAGCALPFDPIAVCVEGSYRRADAIAPATPALESSIFGVSVGLGALHNGPTRRTKSGRPID